MTQFGLSVLNSHLLKSSFHDECCIPDAEHHHSHHKLNGIKKKRNRYSTDLWNGMVYYLNNDWATKLRSKFRHLERFNGCVYELRSQ